MKGMHWSEYKSIDIEFNYDKYHTLQWPIQYSSIKPAKLYPARQNRMRYPMKVASKSYFNKMSTLDQLIRSDNPADIPAINPLYFNVKTPLCPWSGWPHLRDAVLQRYSLGVEEALAPVYSQDCDQSESGEMSAEHWVQTPFSRHPKHRKNPASQAELFPEVTLWHQRPKDA